MALNCQDGTVITHKLKVPSSCNCLACSGVGASAAQQASGVNPGSQYSPLTEYVRQLLTNKKSIRVHNHLQLFFVSVSQERY